jgi:hypothetical protein
MKPGLRVEHRTAGETRRPRTGIDSSVATSAVGAQHPVAVVVDQGLLGDVGEQVRH